MIRLKEISFVENARFFKYYMVYFGVKDWRKFNMGRSVRLTIKTLMLKVVLIVFN